MDIELPRDIVNNTYTLFLFFAYFLVSAADVYQYLILKSAKPSPTQLQLNIYLPACYIHLFSISKPHGDSSLAILISL